MSPSRVVVDGSNIATEGSTKPSLEQLDEAVRAFIKEFDPDEVTVVVDATFGHRIDKSEQRKYEEAVDAGELLSPPAGAVGRGDAFILAIAEKADAVVLSNDSFQEFHGEHEWLFDKGRLIGGKPVPGIGWIFQDRVPVRGPKSRRAVREAKGSDRRTGPSNKSPGRRRGRGRKADSDSDPEPDADAVGGGRGRKRKGKAAPKSKAADSSSSSSSASGGGRKRRRSSGGSNKPSDPVNTFESFIEFAAAHPPGSLVQVEVTEFASHGAYADADGVRCYIPIKRMGDPIPRAARDIVSLGEVRELVVNELDAPRRAIELAIPGFETVEREPAPSAEAADVPIDGYDDMTARQITGALGNLDLEELEAVAAYEESHGARKTVMKAIDTRITNVRAEVEAAAEEALAKKQAAKSKSAPAGTAASTEKAPAKEKEVAKKKAPAKKKAATKKKVAAKRKSPAKKKAAAKKVAAKRKSPAKKKGAAKKKAPARKKTAAKKKPAAKKKTAAKKKSAARKKPAARRR